MRLIALLTLLVSVGLGCSSDKALLMDSKLDASLRQKISSIGENASPQILPVIGKCSASIDGPMRQDLIDAGADVQTMQGDIFTANVSSENIFKVAALDFVTQVQLSKESKPLSK